MHLAPSILTADLLSLGSQLAAVAEADAIHLDVMDGHFVPNLTFGPGVAKAVCRGTSLKVSAHLMVNNPDEMVPWFASAGCREISVHAEAVVHLHRSIQRLKELGVAAGVALNPATPLDVLDYVHGDVDSVLLMTVNPGFGGQSFIPAMYQKIQDLYRLRERWGDHFTIVVDGGVNLENVHRLSQCGVDVAVVGSAVYCGDDPAERVRLLRRAVLS